MRKLPSLLVTLALASLPAAAKEPPACAAPREGATACLAGKLCVCGFRRGGSLTGRENGWRWECGALRPACGEALGPSMSAPPVPLPELILQLPPRMPPPMPR